MNHILITGEDGYIASSLKKWFSRTPEKYQITTLSVRDNKWKSLNFNKFDTIIHTAGVVHTKENKKNKSIFFNVNVKLTTEIAEKAKSEGVMHFIFFSSMSVYGKKNGVINSETKIVPKSFYGQSKLLAEQNLKCLSDDKFIVSIVRPPMVYGRNSVGNYTKISKLAKKTLFFPEINNRRSMIYIDNLCNFIEGILFSEKSNTYHPQNIEYVNTTNLVKTISELNGNKIVFTRLFNFIIKGMNNDYINKIFGDLIYDKSLSSSSGKYCEIDFIESIRITEKVH